MANEFDRHPDLIQNDQQKMPVTNEGKKVQRAAMETCQRCRVSYCSNIELLGGTIIPINLDCPNCNDRLRNDGWCGSVS